MDIHVSSTKYTPLGATKASLFHFKHSFFIHQKKKRMETPNEHDKNGLTWAKASNLTLSGIPIAMESGREMWKGYICRNLGLVASEAIGKGVSINQILLPSENVVVY